MSSSQHSAGDRRVRRTDADASVASRRRDAPGGGRPVARPDPDEVTGPAGAITNIHDPVDVLMLADQLRPLTSVAEPDDAVAAATEAAYTALRDLQTALCNAVDTTLLPKDALIDRLTGTYGPVMLATIEAMFDARDIRIDIQVTGMAELNRDQGRGVGDLALRSLVATLRDELRGHDHIVRTSGATFSVFVRDVPHASAESVLARLRDSWIRGRRPPVELVLTAPDEGLVTATDRPTVERA